MLLDKLVAQWLVFSFHVPGILAGLSCRGYDVRYGMINNCETPEGLAFGQYLKVRQVL